MAFRRWDRPRPPDFTHRRSRRQHARDAEGRGGYSPPSQCLCTSSLPASAPAIQHKTGEWAGSLGECRRTRDEPFSSTCWSVLKEDLRPGTHGVSPAVLVVQSQRGCTCLWLTFSFCANRGWNVHDCTAFSACTCGLSRSKTLQGRIGRALVLGRLLRINTYQLERGPVR